MNLNNFVEFLRNLGFADINVSDIINSVFSYKVPLGEGNIEKIRFAYTPNSTDVFSEHQRSWNKNDTNNFIAVGDNQTHIIDVKVKPNEKNPLASKIKSFDYGVNSEGFEKEKIKEITKDFIDSTYFFDFVIKNKKRKHDEVDKDLLLNLIALRNDLVEIKDDEETIHLLILRCLFIKYLEDKGIYDKGYLTDSINSGEPTKLIAAFEEIKKINGDIFKKQIVENQIDSRYLDNLSRFFTSDYRSGQNYLFPYLFDQIPIQLISNVYEAFLNNEKRQGKGIYYTPPFLVNFILSHSLKEKLKVKSDVTVFDPAVGSGSFLVESFKTIVKKNDNFEKKKSILENQLFGVDVDENALPIAAFSLYLALIETESPQFIQEQIKTSNPILPSLIGKTLIRANAITEKVFEGKTFDCIVSNPPWGSVKPTKEGEEPNIENDNERTAIETKKEFKNVSDYERSQAFLVRVKKWCKADTICALVVKNSIFLNDNSEDFRKEFLKDYQLNYFYELSNYNKILFKKRKIGEIEGKRIETGASEPCAVVVFELPKAESNSVKYISPKLNDFSENFQIIHYTRKDTNEVVQNRFIEDDLLWRILVNGDFEDYKLIKNKLTFENKLEIECRSGFQPKANMESLGEPVWKKLIEPTDFEKYFVKNDLKDFNWNQKLHRQRDENIFYGNRLLIPAEQLKTDEKRLRGIRLKDEIVFKHNVLCLKFKNNSNYIENYCPYLALINSKLISYHFYNVSAQWGKGKTFNTIRNVEVEKLPIFNINPQSQIHSKLNELVLRIEYLKADGQSSLETENEIDELVFDLYGLKEYEKEIVREFYQINVERAEKNEKFVRRSDIESYAKKFAEVFSLMLEENSKLVATKYHSANVGTSICFTIIDKNEEATLEEDRTLEILHFVKKKQIGQADASKILNEEKIKIYDGKLMYIVKSNLFKDWTTRQAIKDANEEIGLLLSQLPTNND
jgi:methylase of polypeptide subunit release factors